MPGPGEYLPDPTEWITRVEDLPKPKVVRRSRDYRRRRCPRCGKRAYRDRREVRWLHDVGDLVSGRPREIRLTVSQHHCTRCKRYFLADSSDLASPGARYTHRVVAMAVRPVVEDGLPYRSALSKLFSPNLERALTFLDDRLLPSTSNAVERTNRRHRKMQKSIYRVRTKAHVSGRIAQDMLREARTQARPRTTQALHLARAA
jgi:ribosomal protein S27AE